MAPDPLPAPNDPAASFAATSEKRRSQYCNQFVIDIVSGEAHADLSEPKFEPSSPESAS